ncbi:MAG: thiamine pyrophosphate-dependent enzyme, partial [Longimicrobiales bacterium]
DVLAVREATEEALKRVHTGSGPVFIEAMTYRFRGHSMADPVAYRDSSELDPWRNQDPIVKLKVVALREEFVTDDELTSIEAGVQATVEAAIRFAEESPEPELDTLNDNLYA